MKIQMFGRKNELGLEKTIVPESVFSVGTPRYRMYLGF